MDAKIGEEMLGVLKMQDRTVTDYSSFELEWTGRTVDDSLLAQERTRPRGQHSFLWQLQITPLGHRK